MSEEDAIISVEVNRLTAPFWQKAVEFFKQKAATARDYIERRSLLDVPPINDVLAMVRHSE